MNSTTPPSTTLPLSNRRSTLLGATIPFLIIASSCVILRLYARVRVVKGFGWDDAFITVAWASMFIGNVWGFRAANEGLGHNLNALTPLEKMDYLRIFYVGNATYTTSSACYKLSLLLQYMRMPAFSHGWLRQSCLFSLALVSLWAFIIAFISWLPCFPVRAFWDRSITHYNCYGFGSRSPGPFAATFESELSTNIILNILVFLLPLVPYFHRGLSQKEIIGVSTLVCIGLAIMGITVAHLVAIIVYDSGSRSTTDYTYWEALPVLLACIEVDLALVAASIPVFYPVIEASFDNIFVTHEVTVTTHKRPATAERSSSHPNSRGIEVGSLRSKTDDSEACIRGWEPPVDYKNDFPMPDEVYDAKNHGYITHIETNVSRTSRIG